MPSSWTPWGFHRESSEGGGVCNPPPPQALFLLPCEVFSQLSLGREVSVITTSNEDFLSKPNSVNIGLARRFAYPGPAAMFSYAIPSSVFNLSACKTLRLSYALSHLRRGGLGKDRNLISKSWTVQGTQNVLGMTCLKDPPH